MKYAVSAAGAAAVALSAGFAAAEGHEDKCFDKGTLTYVDCPAEPAPVVEEEPVVMMESEDGFYIGARGGLIWAESDFDVDTGTAVLPVEQDYDMGYIVSAMVGYKFVDVTPGVSLRPEIEVGYLSAEVDEHDIPGVSGDGSTGDTSVLFGFVNLFADIELIDSVDLIVGGGIGAGQVEFDGHGVAATGTVMDDDSFGFGYNVGAGLGVEVAEDVTLEAMYRYMSFEADLTSDAGDPLDNDVDVDVHAVTIGLRFDL